MRTSGLEFLVFLYRVWNAWSYVRTESCIPCRNWIFSASGHERMQRLCFLSPKFSFLPLPWELSDDLILYPYVYTVQLYRTRLLKTFVFLKIPVFFHHTWYIASRTRKAEVFHCSCFVSSTHVLRSDKLILFLVQTYVTFETNICYIGSYSFFPGSLLNNYACI